MRSGWVSFEVLLSAAARAIRILPALFGFHLSSQTLCGKRATRALAEVGGKPALCFRVRTTAVERQLPEVECCARSLVAARKTPTNSQICGLCVIRARRQTRRRRQLEQLARG